jgi:hypothetical protein
VASVFCIHVANVRRNACGFTAVAWSRIGSPFLSPAVLRIKKLLRIAGDAATADPWYYIPDSKPIVAPPALFANEAKNSARLGCLLTRPQAG